MVYFFVILSKHIQVYRKKEEQSLLEALYNYPEISLENK